MHRAVNGPAHHPVRVTGAWTRLLSDWLDRQRLRAPALRAALAAQAPDDIVPLAQWAALLEQAVALRPDMPVPALDIGAGVTPAHVGMLGYLVVASDHLAQALATYQRYERLFYGADLAEVGAKGGEVSLSWGAPEGDASPLALSLAETVAIAALVSFIRQQVGGTASPSRIEFTHRADRRHQAACEAFFGCPVRFSRPRTVVRVPARVLSLPMSRREPGLRALLDQQAQALLAALPQPGDFEHAVQQMLVRLLPDGQASVEAVAAALHQSKRTLQRRLDTHGLTWQMLLDRTREQLARRYLDDPGLSLAQIALLLGYSEQSAFTRSFRRWTGQTPLGWRRRQHTA